MLLLDHTANATIDSGAKINQDNRQHPSSATGKQQVVVTADGANEMVNITGNFSMPGVELNTEKSWVPVFSRPLYGASGGAKAIGGGAMIQLNTGNVTAEIQNGVTLYADSLDVEADTTNIDVNFVGSGGKADKLALNATVEFDSVLDTTIAQIDSGAYVTVGSGHVDSTDSTSPAVKVNADDTTVLVSIAGSVAVSDQTAVGLSGAVNLVGRTTEAAIGAIDGETATASLGSFTSGGNVAIDATNGGFIGAFAIAGSVSSNSPEQSKDGEGGNATRARAGPRAPTARSRATRTSPTWQSKWGAVLKQAKGNGSLSGNIASTTKSGAGRDGRIEIGRRHFRLGWQSTSYSTLPKPTCATQALLP